MITEKDLATTNKCPVCGETGQFAAMVEAWQEFEFNEKGKVEPGEIEFGDWTGTILCRGCGEELIK